MMQEYRTISIILDTEDVDKLRCLAQFIDDNAPCNPEYDTWVLKNIIEEYDDDRQSEHEEY